MQANLQDCTFYEFYCSDCNSKFRLVLEDQSATGHACPECGVLASLEIVGRGQTIRQLPVSKFLHHGRLRMVDTLLFFGTPRGNGDRHSEPHFRQNSGFTPARARNRRH